MTYNVFSGTLNPTQSTMSCNVVFSVCSCLERMVCRVWKTWKTPGILFCQICKHPNSSSDNMKLWLQTIGGFAVTLLKVLPYKHYPYVHARMKLLAFHVGGYWNIMF